jgi:hypothetical protein
MNDCGSNYFEADDGSCDDTYQCQGLNEAYCQKPPVTSWDGATATIDDWLDTHLWIGALP